jgi:hypothetical protein
MQVQGRLPAVDVGLPASNQISQTIYLPEAGAGGSRDEGETHLIGTDGFIQIPPTSSIWPSAEWKK